MQGWTRTRDETETKASAVRVGVRPVRRRPLNGEVTLIKGFFAPAQPESAADSVSVVTNDEFAPLAGTRLPRAACTVGVDFGPWKSANVGTSTNNNQKKKWIRGFGYFCSECLFD